MRKAFLAQELIKEFLNRFGLRIVRVKKPVLDWSEIDVVYDVGANIGQFASQLRAKKFTGIIVSFEPMEQEHEYLLNRSRQDKKWIVTERCALGASNTEVEINVSKNSYSSSILDIGEVHINSAPGSHFVRLEKVQVKTLDSFEFREKHRNLRKWLKIDVQGYEMEVLKGATSTLNDVHGIQVELSTTQLYLNQPLFYEVSAYLYELGFELLDIEHGFRESYSGQLLQFDAYFIKK